MKVILLLLLIILLLLSVMALVGAMILLYDDVLDVIKKHRNVAGHDSKRKDTRDWDSL